MSLHSFAFIACTAIGICLSFARADAAITYSYEGNTFTHVNDDQSNAPGGGSVAGTYDQTMSVKISFTVAEALTGGFSFQSIKGLIQSFSFFDGRTLYTSADSHYASVSTDLTGSIASWSIGASRGGGQVAGSYSSYAASQNYTVEYSNGHLNHRVQDYGFQNICINPDPYCAGAYAFVSDSGMSSGNPGTWSVSGLTDGAPSIGAAPLPPAVAVLGSSLGGMALLGVVRRRGRRTGTPATNG